MRYKSNDSALGAIVGIVFMFGWIAFCVALGLLKLWLIGSLITSAVKAASDDCGKRYGVESVLSGNWFCPVSEAKNSSEEQANTPSIVSGEY